MNWTQFKDPLSPMHLAGAVVVSWSLAQEVAVSSPFAVMANIFVTEFSELSETFRKNSIDEDTPWQAGITQLYSAIFKYIVY